MNIFKSNVHSPLVSSGMSTYLKATSAMARVKLCATLSVGLAVLFFTWSCAPSSTAAVAVDNGPFGAITVMFKSETGTFALDGTTITITGLVNGASEDGMSGAPTGALTFTLPAGYTATSSVTGFAFDAVTGEASFPITDPDEFKLASVETDLGTITVTPDGGTATTYTVKVVFAAVPVRDIVAGLSSRLRATYGTGPQTETVSLTTPAAPANPKFAITGFYNEASGADGGFAVQKTGAKTVPLNVELMAVGYASDPSSLVISDPDGDGTGAETENTTITIFEGTAGADAAGTTANAAASTNKQIYDVEITFVAADASFGVADISATFNSVTVDGSPDISISGTTITITGLTNAVDRVLPLITGTVTIAERDGVFAVTPGSVDIADPAGAASAMITLPDMFEVTPDGETAEPPYTVVVDFTATPVSAIVAGLSAGLRATYGTMIQVTTVALTTPAAPANPKLIITGFVNKASGADGGFIVQTTTGNVSLNEVLAAMGYASDPSPLVISDPDGDGTGVEIVNTTITIFEGTAGVDAAGTTANAAASTNKQAYDVKINFAADTLPLWRR